MIFFAKKVIYIFLRNVSGNLEGIFTAMYLQKTAFLMIFFGEKVISIFLRNVSAVKNEWKQSFFPFIFCGNISMQNFFVKEIKENS